MGVRRRNRAGVPPREEPEQREPVQLDKPDGLTGYGSAHWDEVMPLLGKLGVIEPIDSPSLLSMCHWWHEYRTLLESTPPDEAGRYKRAIALASCFKHWATMAAKFGLSPKDREKLTLDRIEEHDPAAEFIA